ncbi:DUF2589 domain-containing protein [Nostoc sp. 2RC]|uniref:DUF2589 domain-containing protein n=1 Tax=Nostoc sp. 2RC TaxID=2485484 RepID=UPI001626AFD6|nr:DUF2589 domain-containing protein [Nostoc sp. 2RC]MBC1239132.1 DUF2589 domain-containing protein [Nostoc sp. 2RC]
MALEEDSVLSFRELIAGPLIATLSADFDAGVKFVEFFHKYGLEEENETTTGEMTERQIKKPGRSFKMVTFRYEQAGREYCVEVPLLSLIPLPLLQIDTAEFEFNIRVFTEVPPKLPESFDPNKTRTEADQSNPTANPPYEGMKARLAPAAGKSEDGKPIPSVDANMKVTVKMKQADLPIGMIRLMRVFENSTNVTDVSSNKKSTTIGASATEEKAESVT